MLSSFDVSPTRPLLVLGGDDGSLVVHNLEDQNEKVLVLKGCKGDVTQTKFFPSGEVCAFTLCSWNVGESLTVCSSAGDLDSNTFWTHLRPLCSPITLSDPRSDAQIPHPPSDQPGHPRSRTTDPLWLEGRDGQALERRLGRGGRHGQLWRGGSEFGI